MKEHLIHYFPFLKKEFRKLDKKELKSKETFEELFPNEPIEFSKLKAIYYYQSIDLKIEVTTDIVDKQNIIKVKKNGKV